jgi:hypothetical protein
MSLRGALISLSGLAAVLIAIVGVISLAAIESEYPSEGDLKT